jgi:hypothetical protein
MSGQVCSLQSLLVLTSAVIFRSKFHGGICGNGILSQIRDSPNLDSQVPIFIFHRNIVVQLYHQALGFVYVTSYTSQGYGGGIQTTCTWGCLKVKVLL